MFTTVSCLSALLHRVEKAGNWMMVILWDRSTPTPKSYYTTVGVQQASSIPCAYLDSTRTQNDNEGARRVREVYDRDFGRTSEALGRTTGDSGFHRIRLPQVCFSQAPWCRLCHFKCPHDTFMSSAPPIPLHFLGAVDGYVSDHDVLCLLASGSS